MGYFQVIEKTNVLGLFKYPKGHAECSDARRAKKRTTKRIWIYVERYVLQRNTADERFSAVPLSPHFVKRILIFYLKRKGKGEILLEIT
jgi:hypothetical protein